MCKTTTGPSTGAGLNPGGYPPGAAPVPPAHSLQQYLDRAYERVRLAHGLHPDGVSIDAAKSAVPIAMLAHTNSGAHYYAGVHADEMHYSASLLKAAAMFSAYSLRSEARALAAERPAADFANQAAFFAALDAKFKPNDAVAVIRQLGFHMRPTYDQILKVTGFGTATLMVEFERGFSKPLAEDHAQLLVYQSVHAHEVELGHIAEDGENAVTLAERRKLSHQYLMIVFSDNDSAGQCIRRLGYAYINVKLMKAHLYDVTVATPIGIWLAGDFAGSPRAEVMSVNDALSAQATTARHMTNLFSTIYVAGLADPASSFGEMKAILHEATRVDDSWLNRDDERKFKVDAVKIGVGNLKPNTPPMGPDVLSEGSVLKWKAPVAHDMTGSIAVVWQNLRKSVWVEGIAEIIEDALSDFIAQAPLP